ncbi:MAG: helix-hairpin-helix domain-containing protein [Bacteroidales bacterium]|nr:helix-hairpin-helix domain-containing protein [Bacteroidales bacterium]
MKPTQTIKDYLSFSRGEQRGIVILVLIILLINVFRIYLPDARQLEPVDFSAFRMEIKRFEAALAEAWMEERKKPDKQGSGTIIRNHVKPDTTPQGEMVHIPSFIIELNRADTLDLQRLYGIGPAFARRITGYRAKLGGFISIDQLLEVYGMDSARYMGIRKHLTVDTSIIDRMNLNSISFKELIYHPYMPYELAKEIALYRKKHKGIKFPGELSGMKSMDSVTFLKLRPYISFE